MPVFVPAFRCQDTTPALSARTDATMHNAGTRPALCDYHVWQQHAVAATPRLATVYLPMAVGVHYRQGRHVDDTAYGGTGRQHMHRGIRAQQERANGDIAASSRFQ